MNVNELKSLVAEIGYPVMMAAYEEEPLVYPLLCEVRPHDPRYEFGLKSTTITGIGEFRERVPGREFEADELIEGPVWYCKIGEYGRSLPLNDRLVEAARASAPGNIGDLIVEAAEGGGRSARTLSESRVAGMLQKGTLTAGSREYFNGTFVENSTIVADPYPKFIYDGMPFFDTAHPVTAGSSTYANHAESRVLTEDNYNTTRTTMQMTNNRDERGNRISIRPDVLLVPGGLRKAALQIVGSELQPGAANNDINASRGTANVIAWSYLDDAASSAAWWLLQRGGSIRVYESPLRTRVIHDEMKGTYHVVFSKKFGAVVKDWRYAFACNKAA